MADDHDTWPERIAIPTIRENLVKVNWVRECLSIKVRRQGRARLMLVLAIFFLRRALKALEHNG